MQEVLEHKHPLHLVDLQPKYPLCEEEYDDEEDGDSVTQQDFPDRQCGRCRQEITWFHRYYYECAHSCDYTLHKFCGELPTTLNHTSHPAHTLSRMYRYSPIFCVLCGKKDKIGVYYECFKCDFGIHANCAMESLQDRRIYHPSHRHPVSATFEPHLCKCNACGKEHKGIFYICTICFGSFIHSDCVFLPKKLIIQDTTDDNFSHIHPLILSYSFLTADQQDKYFPRCRVCNDIFYDEGLWIYKCEKCRYYTHIDCATSREESFMSIISSFRNRKLIKDFKDSDVPNLLRLPFLDESYSILKHLFFKEIQCETSKMENGNLKHVNCHQHPLILIQTESSNDVTRLTSSTSNYVLSCHNPMKKIELLCNGCLRPITHVPFYKCPNTYENCNFVLHEWCTQLPAELQNYPDHPHHTLLFHPNVPNKFFSVFECAVCDLPCNGFVYSCVECDYHIDVKCGFIPEKITHEAHSGHLLSRVQKIKHRLGCRICVGRSDNDPFSFLCQTCNVFLHVDCALLLPCKIRHKYDKHPMSLSYFPVENHKSEYFCEICEDDFDPEICFYHCYQCANSIHPECAPVILQSERAFCNEIAIYSFVNMKFGGIHNVKDHPHPLSFAQGIKSDGQCAMCLRTLKNKMIFKCQQCKFRIDLNCCERLSN